MDVLLKAIVQPFFGSCLGGIEIKLHALGILDAVVFDEDVVVALVVEDGGDVVWCSVVFCVDYKNYTGARGLISRGYIMGSITCHNLITPDTG